MVKLLLDENISPKVAIELRRDEQTEVLRRVIVALETGGDLVNRALTVSLDGDFNIEEIPLGL